MFLPPAQCSQDAEDPGAHRGPPPDSVAPQCQVLAQSLHTVPGCGPQPPAGPWRTPASLRGGLRHPRAPAVAPSAQGQVPGTAHRAEPQLPKHAAGRVTLSSEASERDPRFTGAGRCSQPQGTTDHLALTLPRDWASPSCDAGVGWAGSRPAPGTAFGPVRLLGHAPLSRGLSLPSRPLPPASDPPASLWRGPGLSPALSLLHGK